MFDQREDRIVLLLDSAPAEAHHDAVREAAATCPMSAITPNEETLASATGDNA